MRAGLTSVIVSPTSDPMRAGFGAAGTTARLVAAVRLSLRPDEAMPAAVRNCWL